MLHSPPLLEFFLDRSLGKRIVAEALRKDGWRLRTLAEVYGTREEKISDSEWLERCGREDWIVLTKDRRIRYRSAEINVIRRHGVKAVVLPRGGLTAPDQARRFIDNGERIAHASEDDGPFVYAVYRTRIERLYP